MAQLRTAARHALKGYLTIDSAKLRITANGMEVSRQGPRGEAGFDGRHALALALVLAPGFVAWALGWRRWARSAAFLGGRWWPSRDSRRPQKAKGSEPIAALGSASAGSSD